MKVAIYCRVSTEEQDASKQEFELREFCKNRNKMSIDAGRNVKVVVLENSEITPRPEIGRASCRERV